MAYKKKNTPKVEIEEKKLTPQELIQVGNFATRVGSVLATLDAEKVQTEKEFDDYTYKYNNQIVALNEKINLITSDPVKYFRILDTQAGSGLLGGATTNIKAGVGVPANLDNSSFIVDSLKKIVTSLDDIYKNGRGIGDMIYEEIRDRKYPRRGFDPHY